MKPSKFHAVVDFMCGVIGSILLYNVFTRLFDPTTFTSTILLNGFIGVFNMYFFISGIPNIVTVLKGKTNGTNE